MAGRAGSASQATSGPWPDRRLCELLAIAHPILQAPMAGSATPELAAAVSNAGGLGALGSATLPLPALEAELAALRAATNGAYNLNFFIHDAPRDDTATLEAARAALAPFYAARGLQPPAAPAPPHAPGFGPERQAWLLANPPPVASFHFGLPEPGYVAALKAAGTRVIATATCAAEARALEEGGVDAIIAQGREAGGHRGSFAAEGEEAGVGLMALLPQVVDAVSVPVIAAGGISDGRAIAAAFALGAAGVQLGTAFLACPEAGTSPAHRTAIATATDTDTHLTRAYSGRAARARRTALGAALEGQPLPDFPLMRALTAPLVAHDAEASAPEAAFLLYGQAAGLARALPAGALVTLFIEETAASCARIAGRG